MNEMNPAQFAQAIRFQGFTPNSFPLTGESDDWEWQDTLLPEGYDDLKATLEPLRVIPKLSTFAMAALINQSVRQMPEGQCFLNIGTWYGYSFMAGLLGNANKICIGVDNFSNDIVSTLRLRLPPSDPEPHFRQWFDRYRSPQHVFFSLEFRDYFKLFHQRQKIGFYFYDADHAYSAQYEGLELAHPFLAPGAWILVDDINEPGPYQASLDFVQAHANEYQVCFEQKTCTNGHPSFWNGMLLLQKGI
jgi:hypothetical protein